MPVTTYRLLFHLQGGRLIIGWEDNSFKGLVNIILRGDINTEEKVVEGGVVVGAKAIGMIIQSYSFIVHSDIIYNLF